MGLKRDVQKAHASSITGSLKKSAHAPVKKVAKKKPQQREDYTVFIAPDGDVLIESPTSSERAKFMPVHVPKGSTKVATYSDFSDANRHAFQLVAERRAKKAHKKNPAKLTASDFSYIAAMIQTMPITVGDIVLDHCAAFMAESNSSFDRDRFMTACKRGS